MGTRISDMPLAITPLAGTEWIEVVQDGFNKKVPASALGTGGSGAGTVMDFRWSYRSGDKPKASENVFSQPLGEIGYIQANLVGSFATASVAPTASYQISVTQNGTVVATYTFAAGETTAVVSTQPIIQFSSSDILGIVMSPSVDATIAGVNIRLLVNLGQPS